MAISAEWNGYCAKLHKNQFSALSLQGWIDPKYSYLPNEHGYFDTSGGWENSFIIS